MDHDELSRIFTTADAARALNRRPQTLRAWACKGTGPIRPVRIHGRLGWRVEDLQRLMAGGQSERKTAEKAGPAENGVAP